MHFVPTKEEVEKLLRDTGALRDGHFAYPNGLHANQYLQVALAMRYYQHAKVLSVGLSRQVRADPEIRAAIPQLSIVAPATGGLPVAYGVCEALRANQVYWAEREGSERMRFRQFLELGRDEKVLLVDDIMRTGTKLSELRELVEAHGAQVVGLAVMIYEPTPRMQNFGSLPFFKLAQLDTRFWEGEEDCELCRAGIPLQRVWV